jgi:uncharacterized phosphosugar-binding protein
MSESSSIAGAAAYMNAVIERLTQVAANQTSAIDCAADAVAKTIMNDGMVYILGTGHSHMLAEEGHYRAGGLAAVCPVLIGALMLHENSIASGTFERVSGLAPAIFQRYGLTSRDMLFVFSNSGVNAVPVEAALYARSLGMTVAAVCSMAYAAQIPAGKAGMKLADAADIVLDNGGIPGDALIPIGDGLRAGPLSTIGGAFLLNAILVEAAQRMVARSHNPPVIVSANMPGANEHNAPLIARYQPRNPHL